LIYLNHQWSTVILHRYPHTCTDIYICTHTNPSTPTLPPVEHAEEVDAEGACQLSGATRQVQRVKQLKHKGTTPRNTRQAAPAAT
jgi:hypothetical protein